MAQICWFGADDISTLTVAKPGNLVNLYSLFLLVSSGGPCGWKSFVDTYFGYKMITKMRDGEIGALLFTDNDKCS